MQMMKRCILVFLDITLLVQKVKNKLEFEALVMKNSV
jgi:hypothetical protein